MFHKGVIAALSTIALTLSATSSFALSGLGCTELPEYYRAVGTIENGAGSCGLSLEEAKRILARQRGPADSPQYAPVYPRR